MMQIATNNDKNEILTTIKNNIESNIYLYSDVFMYGVDQNFLKVWIKKKKNNIDVIVLKYYNSFQVFMKNNISLYVDDVVQLILFYKPMMISATENIVREIYSRIKFFYKVNYGVVLQQKMINNEKLLEEVCLAKISDMEEIAKLVCSNNAIGSHYTIKGLKEQFLNRIQNSTGRNYIIRKDNQIVAHYATYAETSEIAVMGGLIVHPKYRDKGYGKALHTRLSNILNNENKKVYLFCTDAEVFNMYKTFGANICGKYGKLTLIKEM